MRTIKITLITFLAAFYLYSSYTGSIKVTTFTYQLMHANIFHLLCNCWCIYSVINDRLINRYIIIPVIFISGMAAYIAVSPALTTIGFSGALLAMTGINIAQVPTRRNWITMSALFALWFFIPVMSFGVHLASFTTGLCTGYSVILFKRYDRKRNIRGK